MIAPEIHPFTPVPWMAEALCRGITGNPFFPVRGESPAPAKAICDICPVKAECLAHALANYETGVWGGTTERERRRMRNKHEPRPFYERNCGTPGGYQSHAYYGEEVCDPCKVARKAERWLSRRGAA